MANLDGWDLLILCGAAYIAVTALVRLMNAHRQREVAKLSDEAARQQRRKRAEAKKAERDAKTRPA